MSAETLTTVTSTTPGLVTTPSPVSNTSIEASHVKKLASEAHVRERKKTPQQRAEDVAYTLNHALSCISTDIFVVPTIAAGFKTKNVSYVQEALGYMRGEVVGDLAAVPLTVMTQRFFPGFMDMLGHLAEPLAKPLFHHGARSAAVRWGRKHGLAANDNEVVDRAQHIYDHEIQHFPQALMWNLISYPLSVVGQSMMGAEGGWKHIARNKLLGTVISNVLLIGGRALIPDKAEKFDRMNSKHIIRPISHAVGSVFGIDQKTMDTVDAQADMAGSDAPKGKWGAKVKQDNQTQATTQVAI